MTGATKLRAEDLLAAAVDRWSPRILELSHALHADPEVSREEHQAAERVRALLTEAEFRLDVPQPAAPTALRAESGEGELVAAFCIEYDALPGIGHACGHNVNAAATLGAALALASAAGPLGLTVRVLGTPAEESHGGKVDLLEEGMFDGAAMAFMVHASGDDAVGNSSLALGCWDLTFHGRAAHAATAPEEGVNALSALVIAQTAVGLLRQQLPRDVVVSHVVTDGGSAPNVIPDRASARLEVRAPRRDQLDAAWAAVRRCFEAGAHATGCTLEIEQSGNVFADLRQDDFLSRAYAEAMGERGRSVPLRGDAIASTDMGNVSHRVPSIHPMVGYDVGGAAHHTAEFALAGAGASADLAVVDAAYGLAAAAARAAQDPTERRRLLESAARHP
ncbi:amidohydrolase [Arthrobacter sp.]|uniref:amidohydrolase n=1 Tax=Arthrobacter sp. TaxID=1667 RepID=UPI002590D028|nr:amidohydrolase [Arthrobacter sp.]